ncbi:unnamed protein product, partial [Polarella glacialis]
MLHSRERIDVARLRAQQAPPTYHGRLQFQRKPDLLSFRRLIQTQGRVLRPLTPRNVRYPGGTPPCIPRWKPRRDGVAAFIHVAKAGGTAFRKALLRGPPAKNGGGPAVKLEPNFDDSEEGSEDWKQFPVGRLSWGYGK